MEAAHEDDDEQGIEVQLRECGEHQIYLIKLPESSASRRKWWLFCRQLEYMLFETTANLSNLLHDLEALELTASVRHYRKAGDYGSNNYQHRALMSQFNKFKRSIEPLSGPGKQCSLIPLKVACTVALNRGNKMVLMALGGEKAVPEEWLRQERMAENAANHEIDGRDLLLEEEDADHELGEDELLAAVLSSELLHDFVDAETAGKAAEQEEAKLGRNYALDQPSVTLKKQLEELKQWRTQILCASRAGKRVQEVTVATDCSTLLRFLGWLKAQSVNTGALDCTVFAHMQAHDFLEQFVNWGITERGVSYSTIGTYLNSLLSCANFASSIGIDVDDSVMQGLYNLRNQAEAQGREDRMYRKRHQDWISWTEAQDTRLNAIQCLEGHSRGMKLHEKTQLAEDVVIISMYTCAPPDRVGVIRKLSWENTLKRGGDTGFYIDLTAPRLHKTSKFYGPSKAPLSKMVVRHLETLLKIRQGDEWDFTEQDVGSSNRTQVEYLFYKDQPSRCYDESAWTKRVKSAFKRHSPRHTATPPRLLRSAFITELRSSTDCPKEVLEAAATAMKHSIDTQSSDVYDLETHSRLSTKAFQWCEDFANKHVQSHEEEPGVSDDCDMRTEEGQQAGCNNAEVLIEDTFTVDPPKKNVHPMGSLPSAGRDVRQKVCITTKNPPRSESSSEHTINCITGASLEALGLQVHYRIEWVGHAHVTDWWQKLDTVDVTDDVMFKGFIVEVYPHSQQTQ